MRGPGWHCGTRGLGALRGAWARDAALGSGLGGEPQPGAGSPGQASRGSPGARPEPEGGRWSKTGRAGARRLGVGAVRKAEEKVARSQRS